MQHYSEKHAWLQPKTNLTAKPLNIACENVNDFVRKECELGLTRIWGEIPASDSYKLLLKTDNNLAAEEFSLESGDGFTVAGGTDTAVLYGVYKLLARLSAGEAIDSINEKSAPKVPFRVINHWDNMDGFVERGYAGSSIFFKNNKFDYDRERMTQYARLLASVGINAVAINNVNVTKVSAKLIAEPLLDDVAKLAEIFRPFGVRLCLSVSFDSPVTVGGLSTPDPLDDGVKEFWKQAAKNIYDKIPDFCGFVVKADSEFRDGPAALGRTQADGANTIADALKPFGGVVFWRCFIYNCRQDWRDTVTDRPMAAYQTFMPLDGKFNDNVILQIKFGPVDFQVREPVSPLFSGLKHTKEAIEYQITQEYTGHQIDLYAKAVQWEEVNKTKTGDKTIAEMFGDEIKCSSAVSNIGSDENWTGHTLAQCNLYAFGRMAWSPELTAETVINEWVGQTFEADETVRATISEMLLSSRSIYENYTSPLGIGFMVTPHTHYGPNIEGYEFDKWGTYHRASHKGIGIDRTSKGTKYTTQYPKEIQEMYDDIKACPEEMLLFFHRVNYDYILKSGKTLLQHIYDSHFEGALGAEKLLSAWEGLKGKIPEETYGSVLQRLNRQVENAREWRDIINTYFYRFTGIPDESGRKIFD